MRIYHPDYRVSWWDRLLDRGALRPRARHQVGVDYTLLNRASARSVREFLDDTLNMSLLGDEMVRIDSARHLPDDPEARRDICETLTSRVRFGQIQPGGARTMVPTRWMEFRDAPHGTRALLRLLTRPNPGLKSFVEGDVSEDGSGGWEEYAVGE